jgi:glycosyltransferase involved in cell wall biosynthesis
MEMEVLQNANYVISVNQQMTNWAKEKLGSNQEKCITIGNGYDADDIKIFSHNKKENNRKIFLYAGTLYTYNELEYIFVPFVEFIKKKEKENQNFSNKYSFEFYGNIEPSYYSLLKKNQVKSISFNAPISREKLNEKYNNADYFMMFTVRTHVYAFNSKFCEYLAYKKPIIHFSNDGPVTQFLETYQLGLGIRPHTFIQDMERLFSLIESEGFSYNFHFDTTQFSIERLTEKLEQLFI